MLNKSNNIAFYAGVAIAGVSFATNFFLLLSSHAPSSNSNRILFVTMPIIHCLGGRGGPQCVLVSPSAADSYSAILSKLF